MKGFAPGRTVLRRYWRDGRISFYNVMTVVADDEHGLRLWQLAGRPYWRVMTPDGRTHHDALMDELRDAPLTEQVWTGSDVLMFIPHGRPWSVWWFFTPAGEFQGWYGNLEDPSLRWDDGAAAGLDSADHALDIWVEPDRTWRWKDEDEFAERIDHPLYWTAEEAAAIRARGEALAAQAEAGKFPFDGTWCDFRPDPSWPEPQRPPGWDRPRA
jgi:hypothetical protein